MGRQTRVSRTSWALAALLVAGAVGLWWLSGSDETNRNAGSPITAEESPAAPSSVAPSASGHHPPADAVAAPVAERPLGNPAQAQQNPDLASFLCRGDACGEARRGDPTVADSLEEAAWMRERAFPDQDQRRMAQSLSADAILQKAEADRSAAMRILGLERRIAETDNPAVVEEARRELMLRARQRREFYALYGEFEANLRLAEMAVREQRSATEALMAAMFAARLAVTLGDHKATALYVRLPRELVTAGDWAFVDQHVQLYLQRGAGRGDMLNMQSYMYRPSIDERPAATAGQTPASRPGG
jgi:hypothetical protein